MKSILKKTLACTIAACAITSSVTAFAAPYATVTPKIESSTFYPPTRTNYHVIGESVADVTKYSSTFDFTTTVESPKNAVVDQIGVTYFLIDYSTGKQYGTTQDVFETNANSAWGFDSVPLERVSPVAAQCRHYAYQGKVTLMNEQNGETYVIAR